MAGVTLTVKLNRFPQARTAMARAVTSGLEQGGKAVLADMQRRTPVDTGGLRGSESMQVEGDTLTLRAGTSLPDGRALYVHEGTVRMPARPYMRDAVEQGAQGIVDAIAAAASRELA
jgi:HK97 gp10 family phage protein